MCVRWANGANSAATLFVTIDMENGKNGLVLTISSFLASETTYLVIAHLHNISVTIKHTPLPYTN